MIDYNLLLAFRWFPFQPFIISHMKNLFLLKTDIFLTDIRNFSHDPGDIF